MHSQRMTLPSLFSFLLCLFLLLLTACGASPGASKTVSSVAMPLPVDGTPVASYAQQIYRTWIGGDVSTFDPPLSTDTISDATARMIFAGLLQLDNDLQIQPHLAQSWSLSSDGLQWTFHLQPHLTFSDGTPLTSQDVAYSLDRSLQPATKSPVALDNLEAVQDADLLHAGRTKSIIGDSILTPDANTVILKLHKREVSFLYSLTGTCTYVIEKKMIDKYGVMFGDHLIEGGGAGPFKLAKYIPKKEIDFVPNPYYNGLKPRLQQVIFITDDTRNLYQDYIDGKIEQFSIDPVFLDQNPQYKSEMHQSSTMAISYVAMNFLAKPFDNLRIRQAFALAMNRDTLLHDLGYKTYIATYHIRPLP